MPRVLGLSSPAPESHLLPSTKETNVSVSVELRVTNQEFSEDLRNESSNTYQNFVRSFTQQMDIFYRNIEGYQGIKILSLLPGSIVVDHAVIVALLVTTDTTEKINNVTKNVKEEIVQAAAHQENCTDNSSFCFNASEVMITQPSFDFNATAYCRQVTPKGFEDFYYPNTTKSGLSCVSNCSANTAGAIDCNEGQCQLTLSGPQCFCRETNLYWYQGDRCKSRVSKMAVGMGLAVAALCLVIFVLAAFLFRAKRQKLLDRWGNPRGWGGRGGGHGRTSTSRGPPQSVEVLHGVSSCRVSINGSPQVHPSMVLGPTSGGPDGAGPGLPSASKTPWSSDLTETKQHWYEEEDENWSLPGGFTIQNEGAREDTMRVDLQSVDTSAQVLDLLSW
nr:mucin-3B-like [Anser cygnoides]